MPEEKKEYTGYIKAVRSYNFSYEKMNKRLDLSFNMAEKALLALYEQMMPFDFFVDENGGLPEGPTYLALSEQMMPFDFFVDENGGLPEGPTYHVTVVRCMGTLFAFHSEMLVIYTPGKTKIITDITEEVMRDVFVSIGVNNFKLSHYDYLELVLNNFWLHVFNKSLRDSWNAGIIGAHGDKGYGYRDTWEKAGISFHRGMMLYLLTYTGEIGDTPKHESCLWVINNYNKYLPMILKAEEEAFQ